VMRQRDHAALTASIPGPLLRSRGPARPWPAEAPVADGQSPGSAAPELADLHSAIRVTDAKVTSK
jgi:hypothetical protein